jgi:hypothetical protein
MADFLIDVVCYRCPSGYEIVREAKDGRGPSDWIVCKSYERISYPLRPYDKLCNVFANIKTSDDLLKFVKRFGPLAESDDPSLGDHISDCLGVAKLFRELLLYKQKGPTKLLSFFRSRTNIYGISDIGKVGLVEDSDRGVRLRITADSLLDALWLQLGQELSGHRIIRECRHCGTLFEAGPDTGRRSDATFCCGEHSVRFHSLKRSRGG